MPFYKILSLPQIEFAHTYSAEKYSSVLGRREASVEITYISNGCLQTETYGEKADADKDDILCNMSLTPLRVFASSPHEHHTVRFNVKFEKTDKSDKNSLLLPRITKKSPKSHICQALIDEIIKQHALAPDDKIRCAGLFIRLLTELDNINREALIPDYTSTRYTEQIKSYIYENIRNKIVQRDIARKLGITPEYLCAVFKKSEGISVITFANRIKLERIKELMDKENIPLCKAAEFYGFSDPNYVSRLYKKYFRINITDVLYTHE